MPSRNEQQPEANFPHTTRDGQTNIHQSVTTCALFHHHTLPYPNTYTTTPIIFELVTCLIAILTPSPSHKPPSLTSTPPQPPHPPHPHSLHTLPTQSQHSVTLPTCTYTLPFLHFLHIPPSPFSHTNSIPYSLHISPPQHSVTLHIYTLPSYSHTHFLHTHSLPPQFLTNSPPQSLHPPPPSHSLPHSFTHS